MYTMSVRLMNLRIYMNAHGLPSLPKTTPLGNFLGGSVLAAAALELDAWSSVLSDISLKLQL
jgi:hypothetical protein